LKLRKILVFAAALAWGEVVHAAEVTVFDGDTLRYDGVQAEIWGIISPGRTETCRTSTGRDWPCGERAFQQLSEIAADETFSCAEKEAGFLICRAAGFDAGLLMVKEGLARARQDYKDVEIRAKEARIGLWE